MPTIRSGGGVVTQINIFTVAPEHQQTLIGILAEAAESLRGEPGWLSASIHRSLDGKQVANYAQSADLDAALRAAERLRAAGFMARTGAIATAHPCLYEVALTRDAREQ